MSNAPKRLAILVAGGPAPGINSVIGAATIRAVQDGVLDATDNPLVNAPHTLADVASSNWEHPYSREQAAYPVDSLRRYKYWAPVNRVDNVYGDRNLFCACPAIDSYREEA